MVILTQNVVNTVACVVTHSCKFIVITVAVLYVQTECCVHWLTFNLEITTAHVIIQPVHFHHHNLLAECYIIGFHISQHEILESYIIEITTVYESMVCALLALLLPFIQQPLNCQLHE